MYIHKYIQTCMHAYIHTYIHTYRYFGTMVRLFAVLVLLAQVMDMHTQIHKYIHACIHTYTHTYIHTYIHHTYIQVFRHDGAFIRCFGSPGTGHGMLRVPVDVATNVRDDIAVCEYHNSRVQVHTYTHICIYIPLRWCSCVMCV
jgi:hypothetical protein